MSRSHGQKRNGAGGQKKRGSERPLLKIKVFFFVHDVDDNTSAFSVLPGSHKREVEDTPPAGRLEELAGHVKLTGPAGSVAIWNGRILHTSMDNTDDQARRMLLFNYTHFDMPQYEYCCSGSGSGGQNSPAALTLVPSADGLGAHAVVAHRAQRRRRSHGGLL